MRFGLTLGIAGFALSAFGQATNYGPPATSYIMEAAKYPDAAKKPTPHTADGHPDLNGVWHHYFGNLIAPVGDKSFTLDFRKSFGGANAPRATPDPEPQYKPEYLAKVKMLSDNQVKEDGTSALPAPWGSTHRASAADRHDAAAGRLPLCRHHRQRLARGPA